MQKKWTYVCCTGPQMLWLCSCEQNLMEKFDFFPLNRALSLSAMDEDSTESKVDDLLRQVHMLVERQREEVRSCSRSDNVVRRKTSASIRPYFNLPFPCQLEDLREFALSPSGSVANPSRQRSVGLQSRKWQLIGISGNFTPW